MKFDVATFTSFVVDYVLLLCPHHDRAVAHVHGGVTAFRFWSVGFYLLAASSACFTLHLSWRHDVLLIATATLALQSRMMIWAGHPRTVRRSGAVARLPCRHGRVLRVLTAARWLFQAAGGVARRPARAVFPAVSRRHAL